MGRYWTVLVVLVPAAMVALACVRRWKASGRLSRGGAAGVRFAIWLVVGTLIGLPVTGAVVVGVLNDGAQGVAAGTFIVGAVAALVLVTRTMIADASRGRRRCPRCWYDMSATAGLVCPECGKDARRERRLFKTRRPRRMMAAGVLTLLVGSMVYGGWLWRSGLWVKEAPTGMLLAMSGWMDPDDRGAGELLKRSRGPAELSSWERALGARVSRGVIERGGGSDERRVLFHAQQLVEMQESDGATEDALIALTRSSDPRVQEVIYSSLLQLKKRRPGGPAPASVLAAAAGWSHEACELLGLYDASDKSRGTLLAVSRFAAPDVRLHAVAALVQLAPDELSIRNLLVTYFKDDAMKALHPALIIQLTEGDKAFTDEHGALAARRRALYTDEVRAAMLEAMIAADPMASGWLRAREVLREHPCLTEQERERVP